MKKVELSQVLDLLIAENKDEASAMLHEWFVGKSKAILEELMQEDDEALDDIKSDKEEIELEEFYGDVDLEEADDEIEGDDDMIDGEGDDFGGDDLEGAADDLSDEMGDDMGGDELAGDDMGDEFAGDEMGAEEMPIEDKVEDLEDQLAALKAEFDELMGAEDDGELEGDDFDGDDMDGDMDDEADADNVDDGVDADMADDSVEGEEVDESEDFSDLEESFDLESVKKPEMKGTKEIGTGKAVSGANGASPIPQKKVNDRAFKGEPVEIKGKQHSGYARETAPAVKTMSKLKNQVSKAKDGMSKANPKGDSSAELNKSMPKDNTKSPVANKKK